MLTVVRSRPGFLEKPTEIVRGPACRLPWAWDGLCFAVPFNDPTRDAARDAVWGAAPSSTTNLAWTKDARGNAAARLNVTGDSRITYPDNPAHNKPSTAITVCVRLRRLGLAGEPGGGVLCKRYGASSPWLSWGIIGDIDGDSLGAHITIDGAWNSWENASYVLPTTDWLTAVLRWRSGSTPKLDVYGERGDLKATSSYGGGALSGTITYLAGQPINFNASEDDIVNYWADYSQGLVWSRYLTDTELQALIGDPFGWYAPHRETVTVAAPFPVGPGMAAMGMVYAGR